MVSDVKEGTIELSFEQSYWIVDPIQITVLVGVSALHAAELRLQELQKELDSVPKLPDPATTITRFCADLSAFREIYLDDEGYALGLSAQEFQDHLNALAQGVTTMAIHADTKNRQIIVIADGRFTRYTIKLQEDIDAGEEQERIKQFLDDPLEHAQTVVNEELEERVTEEIKDTLEKKKDVVREEAERLRITALLNDTEESRKAFEEKLASVETVCLTYTERLTAVLQSARLFASSLELGDLLTYIDAPVDMQLSAQQEKEYSAILGSLRENILASLREKALELVKKEFRSEAGKRMHARFSKSEAAQLTALLPQEYQKFSHTVRTPQRFIALVETVLVSLDEVFQTFSPHIQAVFLSSSEDIVSIEEHKRRQDVVKKYETLAGREKAIEKVQKLIEQDRKNVVKILTKKNYYLSENEQMLLEKADLISIAEQVDPYKTEQMYTILHRLLAETRKFSASEIAQMQQFAHRLGDRTVESKFVPYDKFMRRVEAFDHSIDLKIALELAQEVMSRHPEAAVITQAFQGGFMEQVHTALQDLIEAEKRRRVQIYTLERYQYVKNIYETIVDSFAQTLENMHASKQFIDEVKTYLEPIFIETCGDIMLQRYTDETNGVHGLYEQTKDAWESSFVSTPFTVGWTP